MNAASLAAMLAVVAAVIPVAHASDVDGRPRIYTNESYIEEVTRSTSLPLSNIDAMLARVFKSLPARVKVYPTESYYYFGFHHQGVRYAGNIRLDAKDRDAGTLHFAFYENYQPWTESKPIIYRAFGASDGVRVEKIGNLLYRVSYDGLTVDFELNDLATVVPPPHALGADEKYLGPVFDESGTRLFLIFNPKLKIFHFVLDETIKPADPLRPSAATDRILIGARTGFAYYRDLRMDRKILVGVFQGNSWVNNQFDGPFDQLPDSFIKGDELRDAILSVEPSLAGQIDRYGGSPDGSGRFLIAPYLYYSTEEELRVFHQCTTSKRVPQAAYYQCFVIDQSDYGASTQVPLPIRRAAPKARAPGK